VLEKLLERGESVVAVFGAPDKAGRPPDPLAAYAHEKALPVHQLKSWKTPDALELMRSFAPDLCVMAYVTLLVPQPVLEAPRRGTIQYHPSLLPKHRGPSSINWPIAMGETQTGLSIFWPDEGLDQGPILLQKTVDIGPDETLGDVYFKKLFPLGVAAMLEAVDLVKAGNAPKIPQDHSKATYEGWFKKELAEIDWSKPAAQVYNLIRASNPAPGAWGTIKGARLDIFDAARTETRGRPGEIVAIADAGVEVSARDGSILVKRVRGADGRKVAAPEHAQTAGLRAGDRFDPPSNRTD
jgi:methionyl-tRNA formyltransferase